MKSVSAKLLLSSCEVVGESFMRHSDGTSFSRPLRQFAMNFTPEFYVQLEGTCLTGRQAIMAISCQSRTILRDEHLFVIAHELLLIRS